MLKMRSAPTPVKNIGSPKAARIRGLRIVALVGVASSGFASTVACWSTQGEEKDGGFNSSSQHQHENTKVGEIWSEVIVWERAGATRSGRVGDGAKV
jgi:hypothetical protein